MHRFWNVKIIWVWNVQDTFRNAAIKSTVSQLYIYHNYSKRTRRLITYHPIVQKFQDIHLKNIICEVTYRCVVERDSGDVPCE